MLKLIGGMAVMISCSLCASYITSLEKRKIEQTEAFIELIKHIRNQIDCYSMPIEKIFLSAKDMLLKLGIEKEIRTFSDLLSECEIESGEEAKKTLNTFAESLGKGYRENQVKMCDGVLSELEVIRKKLTDAYPSKKKTTAALCFAGGGALLIALL